MKFKSVLTGFVLAMVIGCSGLSKIAVPEDLLAEEDELRIHYFYEDANAAKGPNEKTHVAWWSEEVRMSDADREVLQAAMLHNVRDETGRQRADAIGLTRFPIIVLVNDKEIVLKTDDLDDVIDSLKKNRQGS
ncbi:hypothetical protein MHI43_01370 [Paenibacillus sp. FSL H8-0457]|uniref:hypothetical protein n=1 Tax=unclassified Paenibacillus TaxID=185978 RepID=UPI0003E28A1B|nr:hypothetical protein [Paenibacillus sp. FSL H8-457]ETT60141.1 hypothetical protein C172_24943 [Paenibacillus sp. FSL H8-457]